MESAETINARALRLQEGLERAFGVRAKSLDKALKRTGRRLPRKLQAEARRVVEAQGYGGQPKLMRQVDATGLDRAEARVLEFLQGIDRAERRQRKLLGIAGVLAFNILLIFGVFVTWMWWSGNI